MAISSPLLESSIEGAKGVVFNITGGSDLTLHEVNTAAETIYEVVDPDANIIFGAVIDDTMEGEIKITAIATGFSGSASGASPSLYSPATAKKSARPAPPSNNPQPRPAPPSPPTPNSQDMGTGLDIPDFLQRRRFPRR